MKLIKSGVVPVRKPQEYDGTCHNCGCIVRVTPDEMKPHNFGQPPEHDTILTGHAEIQCPTVGCGHDITKFKPYITR